MKDLIIPYSFLVAGALVNIFITKYFLPAKKAGKFQTVPKPIQDLLFLICFLLYIIGAFLCIYHFQYSHG